MTQRGNDALVQQNGTPSEQKLLEGWTLEARANRHRQPPVDDSVPEKEGSSQHPDIISPKPRPLVRPEGKKEPTAGKGSEVIGAYVRRARKLAADYRDDTIPTVDMLRNRFRDMRTDNIRCIVVLAKADTYVVDLILKYRVRVSIIESVLRLPQPLLQCEVVRAYGEGQLTERAAKSFAFDIGVPLRERFRRLDLKWPPDVPEDIVYGTFQRP